MSLEILSEQCNQTSALRVVLFGSTLETAAMCYVGEDRHRQQRKHQALVEEDLALECEEQNRRQLQRSA